MKQSKNLLTFTSIEDMNNHAKEHFVQLVVYKSIIYDLTNFVYQHPGGLDAIQQYIGQPLDQVLFNPIIHKHQPQIITQLEKFKYGILLKPESLLSEPKQTPVKASSPKNIGKTRKFLMQNIHDDEMASPFSQTESQPIIQNQKELQKQFSLDQYHIPSDENYKVLKVPKLEIKLISSFASR